MMRDISFAASWSIELDWAPMWASRGWIAGRVLTTGSIAAPISSRRLRLLLFLSPPPLLLLVPRMTKM